MVDCWWVVDQGSGGRDDSGGSIKDSSISLTPLPLSRSSSSSNKGKVGSCGLSNLRGDLDWFMSNTESSSISNILDLLELTVGINIRVSTADSSVGVSSNMSIGVDVGITVVQVSELIPM